MIHELTRNNTKNQLDFFVLFRVSSWISFLSFVPMS